MSFTSASIGLRVDGHRVQRTRSPFHGRDHSGARTLEFVYEVIARCIRGAVRACHARRVSYRAIFLSPRVSFRNRPPAWPVRPTPPWPRWHRTRAVPWDPSRLAVPLAEWGPPQCHARPPRPCTHAMASADAHGMGWAGTGDGTGPGRDICHPCPPFHPKTLQFSFNRRLNDLHFLSRAISFCTCPSDVSSRDSAVNSRVLAT
jgi:hypothetical protein